MNKYMVAESTLLTNARFFSALLVFYDLKKIMFKHP